MQKLFFLCLVSVLLVSCNKKQVAYIEDRGDVFHTTYSIKYKYSHSLRSEIEAELAKFDDSLNPFKPASIISKVNNNETVVLDTFFVNVFNKAQQVAKVSDGLFDITVSPLINAWGFGFKNIENVTPEMIDSLRTIVGYEKIQLQNGQAVKADSRIQINTSAIAKGYSADVVANLLESYGINDYMVEIGGEVRAKGVNAKAECWHIGIDKPIDEKAPDRRELQAIVQLCDKGMATSGSYRNFYLKEGKKYAHTIDPKTGYPSESNILSATVIADDCMTADAYATVFMLADTARIRRIAMQEQISYLLILDSGNDSPAIVTSSDFEKYLIK